MLTEKEKILLNKKLRGVSASHIEQKQEWIKKWGLDKESSDPKWIKFVAKRMAWIDKYHAKEYRSWRAMYTHALYDLRKGKKSPWINI